ALARWFPPKQRAFCQTAFAAVGGTSGEGTANLVLPYLAVHVASGWRQSTEIVATGIVVVAMACLLFLRSAPHGEPTAQSKPFDVGVIKDIRLWSFTLVYTGSIVSLRLFPVWLPIYAADIYISRGMPVTKAVLAASVLTSMYLAGRLVG